MFDNYEFDQMVAEAKIRLGSEIALNTAEITAAEFGWPLSHKGRTALLLRLATLCRWKETAETPSRGIAETPPREITVNHYLLTIYTDDRQHMHGYLMCDGNQSTIEKAIGKMLDSLEAMGVGFMPATLATQLTTGVNTVRKIACKQNKAVKKLISQATNFHFTAWIMPEEHPDDARLMKLH